MLLITLVILLVTHSRIEGVTIEYPQSPHIQERERTDLDQIEPIFRYYIVPREIQYNVDALKDRLPYFIQCKGSQASMRLTVPPDAVAYLSLNTDYTNFVVTATLRQNQYRSELVGRYSCSETNNNNKKTETTVHVFIQDGSSVFTKRLYKKVLKETGVHFFNLPCQATTWFPRLDCPSADDPDRCPVRTCSTRERLTNELKCNLPFCNDQPICIPVHYQPNDLKPSKVFFDPQIGFALEGVTIPNSLNEFTCKSDYTPSQSSKIPYEPTDREFIEIHQKSLNVLAEEEVKLSCEIRYQTKLNRTLPSVFWFDDIYGLKLVSNDTEKHVFNPYDQYFRRNTSITLRGFKPGKTYRFYCVRASEQGIYSSSVEISCVDAPSLDLDIGSIGSDTIEKINYGSDGSYGLSVFTVPRSELILEISRNGVVLTNDKRFELISGSNQENQYHEYTLTIYNVNFEDETDLLIKVKSSVLERSLTLKPIVTGNPVGQISFVSNQIPHVIPWREENTKNGRMNIYALGFKEQESYRIVCNIRHRSDIEQPLNVSIKHFECSVKNCLSDVIDKSCGSSQADQLSINKGTRINAFQTQFVSNDAHSLDQAAFGRQYICCYESKGTTVLAKALTAIARTPKMFSVDKPEFGLVTGGNLNYRCQGHHLIYDDLRMIYNDGLTTYQRDPFDAEWRRVDTNQVKQVDLEWLVPTSENIPDTTIEVKTPPLKKIGKNGFLQCIALSKRPDVVPNSNDTYTIYVDDPVPLKFKKNLTAVVEIERKAGTDVEFDCTYEGRPQPKITWFRGKLAWTPDDSTVKLRENNGSILIARTQGTDTGFYSCELYNGQGSILRRSFNLRVKGPVHNAKFRRYTAIFITISACLILLLLILLIIVAVKYFQMRRLVLKSIFHTRRSDGPVDESQPPMKQLRRLPLPDNFASSSQIKTLLGYVNGTLTAPNEEDFKVLGKGQYGVVYQVRLPEVGLVAAKLLPESIRAGEGKQAKRKKNRHDEESQEMINKSDDPKKKKAAEMLIDELKVMNKVGKHVNIVSLVRVAYPEVKFRYLLTGGLIREEDSFYLMELCSNGSLESMLKKFLKPSNNSAPTKLSLYEILSKQTNPNMTLEQAHDLCELTTDDLTLIAYQVASGVDYLNRRQIAHCDIAARNVLVNTRFAMKICDFGLATWTTYENYREQYARNQNVQIEKKNNELATHNLTPELARAILRASTPDEHLLLNKSSMKADVWSFGIFLWTLFLKCRMRPFEQLSNEVRNNPNGGRFFDCLADVVSKGQVLDYIDYQEEIPPNIYAIIRDCLTSEDKRPEMTKISNYLCHPDALSKRAFEYYESEYNRYQEEISTEDVVTRFGGVQGITQLPTYSAEDQSNTNRQRTQAANALGVTLRPAARTTTDNYYQDGSDITGQTTITDSEPDYSHQRNDSYLVATQPNPQKPTTGTTTDEMKNVPPSTERDVPVVSVKGRAPHRPAPPAPPPSSSNRPDIHGDSYV